MIPTATLRQQNAAKGDTRRLPSPKRFTVASGKGGVGKTWFAITLAQALALEGERVLLVDGDLGLANVDVQLGLVPQADLAAVIGRHHPLDAAVTAVAGGHKGRSKGGFDVLPGSSGSGALAALKRAELHHLADGLDRLAAAYDRLIVDLGAGLDATVTTLATHGADKAGTHAVLVVLTDEPTSLTDAYAFIKVVRLQAPEADLRIIVNRAPSHTQGMRTYRALESACRGFLKFAPPLAGIVPEDSKVTDAIRHQSALLTRHAQSKAAAGVIAIARALREGLAQA